MGQRHSKNSIVRIFVTRSEIEFPRPRNSEVPSLSLPPPPEFSACVADYCPQNPLIDVVKKVAQHLDPVSTLCLRYTSLKLLKGLEKEKDFTVDRLLGRRPTETSPLVCQTRDSGARTKEGGKPPQYDLSREGRLQLLRHFLKDGFFGDGQSICGACLNIHRDALFLPVELQKPDSGRRCKGRTGKVWVCPHRSLEYKDISLKKPIETQQECFKCTSIHVTTPSGSSARVCFPIKRRLDPSTSILNQGEAAAAMALLGPVFTCCPKFALSSMWDVKGQQCKYCSAHYDVDTRPSDRSDGSDLLRLVVKRDFTKITGVTDPKWLAQLVQMEEAVDKSRMKKMDAEEPFARWEWKLDAAERTWKEAATHCKRVMHVGDMKDHDEYSICKDCIGKSCLKA